MIRDWLVSEGHSEGYSQVQLTALGQLIESPVSLFLCPRDTLTHHGCRSQDGNILCSNDFINEVVVTNKKSITVPHGWTCLWTCLWGHPKSDSSVVGQWFSYRERAERNKNKLNCSSAHITNSSMCTGKGETEKNPPTNRNWNDS